MSKTDTRPQISNIPYWRNVANEGRGSQMTQCLHMACDYAVKLEADRAELVEALKNLTTQPPRTINFNAARAILARLEADK